MTERSGSVANGPGCPRVVLIGKPGCHLCETARKVVDEVTSALGVSWEELSVLEDPDLAARYAERIPVVLVDGRPLDYWRVDPHRLTRALTGRRRWRPGRWRWRLGR